MPNGRQRVKVLEVLAEADQGKFGRQYTCRLEEQDGVVTEAAVTCKGFNIEAGTFLEGEFPLNERGRRKSFPMLDEEGNKYWMLIFKRHFEGGQAESKFKKPSETRVVKNGTKVIDSYDDQYIDDVEDLARSAKALAGIMAGAEATADLRLDAACRIFNTLVMRRIRLVARPEGELPE